MKQAILAVASLLATNLGLPQAQAATAAADFLAGNSPNNLTVKQQKAIFAFSRDRASMTMDLIARWTDADAAQRQAMTAEFVAAFYDAVNAHRDAQAVTDAFGSSMLMADTLGNAKALVAEQGSMTLTQLDAVIESIKASVMRACHERSGEIVVPYVPQKLAWPQHGQHFKSENRTPARSKPNRNR